MTDQSDWQRLNALLEAALELSGQARLDFIKERCGDDAALKRELLQMLALDSNDTGGIQDALRHVAREATTCPNGSAEATLQSGDKIGPFEIVRLLGAGGMGEVYEAK